MIGSTPSPSAPALSPAWLHRVLDAARTRLGMEVAWMSTFTESAQLIQAASGALEEMHVQEGMQPSLEGSFCVRVLGGQLPPVVTAARRNTVTRDLAVTADLGIGSYVGAPVRSPDGRPVGMLCCLSRDDGAHLDGAAARTLELLADLIADRLADPLPAPPLDPAGQVREVLLEGGVVTHVQPIVDLASGATVAYEALARFPEVGGGPAGLFSAAAAAGLGRELEELAARAALAVAPRLPAGRPLGINLSPDALLSRSVTGLLLDHRHLDLAVEVTEHSPVADYDALERALGCLREAGIGLTVDDAGAGYASLRHVLRLRPDAVKLDIALVSGLHTDPAKQAMVTALVSFAAATGTRLVAEGVEEAAELETLRSLGVGQGQGHLFGRPAPLL
ncbi:sensor domain-containing phosphodiesterase [Modestobacter roseus]|uniref:EAL domain-containing protein (Putative c-di-GMP-specific phosphodiesterase class I) n=1 Tax=Modestobacter roseus TaxID=1181884 RepID=A0A562ISU3_9ACTN|nr:EAL domain-containing protein [Modestobacter roseus]MQA34880.1 EAL domain-containing protein [Modestobacter roseus]TWH74018.1 EAL domain-containing protein (putative c-di-GMP-specific phosphodiesterase class I) [Modestobacter roseus]